METTLDDDGEGKTDIIIGIREALAAVSISSDGQFDYWLTNFLKQSTTRH